MKEVLHSYLTPFRDSLIAFYQHIPMLLADDATRIRWTALAVLWGTIWLWHFLQRRHLRHVLEQGKSLHRNALLRLAIQPRWASYLLLSLLTGFLAYHDMRFATLRAACDDQFFELHALREHALVMETEFETLHTLLAETRTSNGEVNQAALDALKPEYENLYIHYYILAHCDAADTRDYHLITSALTQELSRLHAPAREQQNIAAAALGSYTELYMPRNCAEAEIPTLKANMQRYLEAVLAATPQVAPVEQP